MNVNKEWFDIEPLEVMTPNGKQTVSRIRFNGIEPTVHLMFSNGVESYEMDCTFNHPLRTTDEIWVQAEHITPEHIFDGNFRLVSSLVNSEDIPTFDFEVPEEHCYILESGIVSHNTALLMGGVSEGINPDPAMTYNQTTAGGEMVRINPILLNIMKAKNVYTKKNIREVNDAVGSVQNVTWLSDEEKAVFKTAFEINQEAVIRMASARSMFIDQWQSLNLFFSAEEDEAWISHIHQMAFEDPNILALYYVYSQSGVQAAKGDCEACS